MGGGRGEGKEERYRQLMNEFRVRQTEYRAFSCAQLTSSIHQVVPRMRSLELCIHYEPEEGISEFWGFDIFLQDSDVFIPRHWLSVAYESWTESKWKQDMEENQEETGKLKI